MTADPRESSLLLAIDAGLKTGLAQYGQHATWRSDGCREFPRKSAV